MPQKTHTCHFSISSSMQIGTDTQPLTGILLVVRLLLADPLSPDLLFVPSLSEF